MLAVRPANQHRTQAIHPGEEHRGQANRNDRFHEAPPFLSISAYSDRDVYIKIDLLIHFVPVRVQLEAVSPEMD